MSTGSVYYRPENASANGQLELWALGLWGAGLKKHLGHLTGAGLVLKLSDGFCISFL